MNEPTLKRCIAALTGKHARIARRVAYYDGTAMLPVISERLREVYHHLNVVGAENWAAVVVDSMIDRITLRGLAGPDAASTAALAEAWSATNLALESTDAHEAALVGGEAYLIAWRDGDGPLECYTNDPRTCHVFYDTVQPNVPVLACKWWDDPHHEDGAARFLKVYTTEEIATYRAAWRSSDAERPDASRFQMVDAPEPNPFGVIPVFHLRPRRRAISELDVCMPIQDGINILLANMLVTAEFNAAPLKYIISNATGIEDLVSAPNRVWTLPAGGGLDGVGGTQVGQFGAADLGNYLSAVEQYINALSSITRTPKHYFQLGQTAPSGEALRVMDGPLVKKCRDRMDRFTPTYQALGAFLCQLMGHTVSPAQIQVQWAHPEVEQPLQQAHEMSALAQALAAKRQAGMSRKQGLRELGYSDDQIAAMDAEEASDPYALSITQVIDLVEARLLARTRGMVRLGVDDPDAEATRIQAEAEASASLGTQVLAAFDSGQ